MKTAYSKYNLMKFHVLNILKDQKWKWWHDIYKALPLEPKPTPDSFQKYIRRLYSYGDYQTYIKRRKQYRKYKKRTYVLRMRKGRKVYYKISNSGLRIYQKLHKSTTLRI